MLIKVEISVRGEGNASHVIAGLKSRAYSPLLHCHNGTLNIHFPGNLEIQSLDHEIDGHGLVDVRISKTKAIDWMNGFIFVPQYTRHIDSSFAELVFPTCDWVSERPKNIIVDIDCEKKGQALLINNRSISCRRETCQKGCESGLLLRIV